MRFLKTPSVWIAGVIGAALSAAFMAWLLGAIESVPSFQRASRALKNVLENRGLTAPPAEEPLRVVVCWLSGDYDGSDTASVARVFNNMNGVDLVESASIVSAPKGSRQNNLVNS